MKNGNDNKRVVEGIRNGNISDIVKNEEKYRATNILDKGDI